MNRREQAILRLRFGLEGSAEKTLDDVGREFGITRERDKSNPNQVIQGNEQSLALLVNGLQRGESRHLYRSFSFRPLDVFNYTEMKMFVHGDAAFSYESPDRYDAEVFIRFGADSLNLSVAAQTTNSLRSVFGLQYASTVDVGFRDELSLLFRAGWSHEYADTSRPMTASFTGAPALTTAYTSASPAGTPVGIAIATGTLASPNYQLAFANGSITIAKAPLTVNATVATGWNDATPRERK